MALLNKTIAMVILWPNEDIRARKESKYQGALELNNGVLELDNGAFELDNWSCWPT